MAEHQTKLVSQTRIYLDTRNLINEILDITPNFPKAYKFSIGEKMHELSIGLIQEIAAAYMNRARDLRQVMHSVNSINSYLGLLRHSNEYAMRRKILNMIEPPAFEYIYIKGRHEAVALKNKYKTRRITLKRIRDGDYWE